LEHRKNIVSNYERHINLFPGCQKGMNKINAIILANELPEDHQLWIKACDKKKEKVEFRIVNLTRNDWLERVQSRSVDILLAKPGGLTSHFKQLYDERVYILERNLGYKIYPSVEEILIYENKRFLSYWLNANNIPHPPTDVFYNQKEAEEFLSKCFFPIVAKTNIGASGSGIMILKNQHQAINYLRQTFSLKGAPKQAGPNLSKGNLIIRGLHYFKYPNDLGKKLRIYRAKRSDYQYGYVIFQRFIPHDFEWRVVRIGDSFFAHQKLKIGDKASGSLIKAYENPPYDLLDFVKSITDRHRLFSQAVDVFETDKGYLINEMQCIFGQSDPYQMLVNGIPGRYRFIEDIWNFEEGMFNTNESYDLRLEYAISMIEKDLL